MVDKEKDILLEIIHGMEAYFISFCVNDNWNDMGVMDKNKMCAILDEQYFTFCCCYQFINGSVWSIKIDFSKPLLANSFEHSPESSFPKDRNDTVHSIMLFVTKKEIEYLRKIIFFDDKSKFWENLKNN